MEHIKNIISAVTDITGISHATLKDKSRKRHYVDARKIVVGVARKHHHTLAYIGEELNRDHSSIIYLARGFDELYKTNPSFKGKTDEVIQQLKIIKLNRIRTMKAIKFGKEPPLWPECYTDFFNFSRTSNLEEVKACIEEATKDTPQNQYHQVNYFQIATNDQKLVEELTDAAYSYELVYQHTHIPRAYGQEGNKRQ